MNLIAAAIIGIAVIVLLIAACKVHPFLSLLAGSFVMAVCAGVPFDKAFDSFTSGVGGTISNVGLLIAFGSIIGTILFKSGGADTIVDTIMSKTPLQRLPWAMALIAFIVGIPMFFEVGVVILIPVVLFAVAVFLSFSTGTSWGTFAILVPIATGMFAAGTNLEMMIISVSAVLAGAVCGDHISPISDTTVMSSAGAQSNHLNHVSTQMQYAAVTACVCLGGISDCSRDQNVVDHTWRQPSSFVLASVLNRNAQYLRTKKTETEQKIKRNKKTREMLDGREKEPYTKK